MANSIIANLSAEAQQQLTELLKVKYGSKLKDIEITEVDIKSYQPGKLEKSNMINQILKNIMPS